MANPFAGGGGTERLSITIRLNLFRKDHQRSALLGSPLLFFCTRSLSFTDALPSRRLHPTASTVGGLLTAFVLLAFLPFRCSDVPLLSIAYVFRVLHVLGEGEAMGTGPCASLQMILADDRHTFMMKKHYRFCKILNEVSALSLLSLTRELPSWLYGPKAVNPADMACGKWAADSKSLLVWALGGWRRVGDLERGILRVSESWDLAYAALPNPNYGKMKGKGKSTIT